MKKTPTELANEILRQKQIGKAAYGEADRLTRALYRRVKKGELIETAEGPHKVVNNFQGKDMAVAVAFARKLSLDKATKQEMGNGHKKAQETQKESEVAA